MMQQLWKSFPRQFEQKVNDLLDQAEPNSRKAFQLYKTCQHENLYQATFQDFAECLSSYFSKARRDRHKSGFDVFLDRPMDQSTHEQFHLTFRSAAINPAQIRDIASWAHHVLRVGGHIDSAASSIKTINEVLIAVTRPTFFQKEIDIEFSDICDQWEKIVSAQFGPVRSAEVAVLFKKLGELDHQSKALQPATARVEGALKSDTLQNDFYNFTQTELTWIKDVQRMAKSSSAMPKYPMSKGPQKIQLVELERIVTLYTLVQLTDKLELLKHQESIRHTLLDRCDQLLQ